MFHRIPFVCFYCERSHQKRLEIFFMCGLYPDERDGERGRSLILNSSVFRLFHLDFTRPMAGETLASFQQTDVMGQIPVQK